MEWALYQSFAMIPLANCKGVGLLYMIALAGVVIWKWKIKKPKK